MSCFPIFQKKKKVQQIAQTTEMENGTKKMKGTKTVKATVVLSKPNIVDTSGVHVDVLDWLRELLGQKVSLQLISAVKGDVDNKLRGKLGKPAYLENWRGSASTLKGTDAAPLNVTFEWDEEMGVPGAFVIRNEHKNEFLLKTVTIEDVPGHGRVHFVCNSWVYPSDRYERDRVFFTNKTYLPHETPEPLRGYREDELENLRGDGTGERREWDRIYDYDVYNDLSEPSKGPKHIRPILGGSADHPYPRRGRTGRAHTKEDPNIESRPMLLKSIGIYVPRDERFGQVKMADVVAFGIKSLLHFVKPGIEALIEGDFENLEEIMEMYECGVKMPKRESEGLLGNVKDLLQPDDDTLFKFPKPQVIENCVSACMTDEEFARQMLAGINPVVICRLKEFPSQSKLNPENNPAMKEYLVNSLDGLSANEAIERSKLFILDHHDTLMPFLRRINDETSTKTYATRTLLFLKEDGTLKPLAIELSLPHDDGVTSDVYTPAEYGTTEGTLWMLAKAYVNVNDSGCHQLISHWLKTHAAIEPFIIATNRQLSALHPINKLLHPHFRDTMNINAFGRQILISAGGALEMTVCPAKYSLEITSIDYKNWVFPEQALPADLIKRGMATKDENSPNGVRLTIEDYPFAVDGLEVWSAIESWVREYCNFYYKEDETVQKDTELQSWWTEIREKGHGDHKDKPWWPRLDSRDELIHTCTIIIWVASALHAAINFGQYPYGGYMPSRPAMSRRLLPEQGTEEYKELAENPERAFLKTVTSRPLTVLGNSLVEILSMHSADEVYLGERDSPNWTSDSGPLEAFEKFGERLRKIEANISERNSNGKWKNRVGAINVPYTLLYPSSETGLTGKGIPNSISM